LPEDTNPVVTVENSSKICIDNLKYKNDADLLISIGGERSKDVKLLNTDMSKAKKQTDYFDNAKTGILLTK
jgi:DNA sulfur modification protein DndE